MHTNLMKKKVSDFLNVKRLKKKKKERGGGGGVGSSIDEISGMEESKVKTDGIDIYYIYIYILYIYIYIYIYMRERE